MAAEIVQSKCPLCNSGEQSLFHQDRHREYLRCAECYLIHVPSHYFLSPEAEKAEYDLHENSPSDMGYRRFLGRLAHTLHARLAPMSDGLDFGCGPGPTLSVMLKEMGHRVETYDRFYAEHPALFDRHYDFITATEVVEHLHKPRQELDRLWRRIRPGGYLGIMTKLALDQNEFARWHYKADQTHVCFFSRQTFTWLAAQWQATLTFIGKDVILLQKADTKSGELANEAR